MHKHIPSLADKSAQAMSRWFFEMADQDLIFHPEDPAAFIVFISDGTPFFSKEAAANAQAIVDGFFSRFSDEAVNNAAYPGFMRAAGMPTGEE